MAEPDPSSSIHLEPQRLVELALDLKAQGLCASFNEPSIQVEYLVDTGFIARDNGLYLALVTNGYMSLPSLKKFLEAGYTGFSIDIKGCPETYKRFLGADPLIIYKNAKTVIDYGGHVEMVYLVVTDANDWDECIEWVIDKHLEYLGEDTPLHINRYYPAYKYHKPPTKIDTLIEAREKALRSGIKYVYIGNTPHVEYKDTYCPRCGRKLIARRNYRVVEWKLTRDNRCPYCGYKVKIYPENYRVSV